MALTTALVATAVVGGVTASKSAGAKKDAARDAAEVQAGAVDEALLVQNQATDTAQGFFQPFQQVGQQGLDQSGFLTDPNAQFDFLQNNPLFKLALDNANQVTSARAASRGRLNAGDTLTDLSNNVLLSASPLISQQKQSINSLLNLGAGTAANQANITTGQAANAANLLTDKGAVQAGGIVGVGNARSEGIEGVGGAITNIIGAF